MLNNCLPNLNIFQLKTYLIQLPISYFILYIFIFSSKYFLYFEFITANKGLQSFLRTTLVPKQCNLKQIQIVLISNNNMQSNQKNKTARPSLQLQSAYKQINFHNSGQVDATFKVKNPERSNSFFYPEPQNSFENRVSQNSNLRIANSSEPKNLISNKSVQLFRENQIPQQQQQDQMLINCQPLYLDIDEVDHNIEEIGIMAVREVRYVDDQQWEQMLAEQKKYAEAIKKTIQQDVRKTRKIQAQNRKRNNKGQFSSKNKQDKQSPKVKAKKHTQSSKTRQNKKKPNINKESIKNLENQQE